MLKVALSTMWGIKRFENLAGFFAAGQALGFSRFELNHGVNSAMLDGAHLNGFRITSVHEPCPADISVAELKRRNWLISATDEENRKQGVAAVLRSIDLAHELSAQVVIVHPGQVDMDTSLENAVMRLYREGKANTPEYVHVRDQMFAERAERDDAHLQAVRKSLDELAEHATRQGIRLGLENRDHYHEIPLLDELDDLLSRGYGKTVAYWHDVGHAHKSQLKGYGLHEEWLTRFAHKIIGVHLHDLIGMDDHLAAGQGQMDWHLVARYLPTDALCTCEFQNHNSPEQVAAGVRWLVENLPCGG